MFYDLDEGYIDAVAKLRLNTLIKVGAVLPKGFSGSFSAWAKACVMKEWYHRNNTGITTWQELLDKSSEYESSL